MSALFVVLLVVHGRVADAQVANVELSKEQFLARIDGKLPEVERYVGAILAAEAKVAETRALPAVTLSYEREEVFTGGDGVALKNAVSLGWSVDISGRRGRQARSAELNVQAVRKRSEYGEHRVIVDALAVYLRAAYARLRVASLQSSRGPLAELVTRLKNRVGEGDASGFTLTRFELQLSEHDDLLAEAIAQQLIAQSELAVLVGAGESQIVANDNLELSVLQSQKAPSGSQRSDILATQYEEDSGRALMRAASRWWVPTLNLSVGYLDTDIGAGSGMGENIAYGYTGMISASIPIFSRGKADSLHAKARIREAQAKRRILERRITTEVQSVRTLLASRIKQANNFKERQLVQASQLAQKTEAAYQGGEASALELRDAYSKASASQLRYIELRYLCSLAELALWNATGTFGTGESE
jgi:outer membrane protein TolC